MFYQKPGQSSGEGITGTFLLDFLLIFGVYTLKLLYLCEEFEQAAGNQI